MLKKIVSLSVALCMTLALMVPGYAQGKENISSNTIITEDNIYEVLESLGLDSNTFTKSNNVKSGVATVGELQKAIEQTKKLPSKISVKEKISSETIITEDNIYEVLDYLGLDSSNFTKSDNVKSGVTKVGELQKAIEQAKKLPSKVVSKGVVLPSVKDSTSKVATNSFNAAATSTIMLYSTLDVDSYTVEFSASGQYNSSKQWTGVGSLDVDVDSDALFFTYKIDSKKLTASYTSSVITMNHDITVGIYVGVGDYGLIKTGSQNITGYSKWYASSEL